MRLASKEYVEPDDEVTWQAISQRNQMQTFLVTDGPLVPTMPRDRPVATQDNHITDKAQVAAHTRFFGRLKEKRTQPTSIVTTATNLLQRKLQAYRNIC